MLEYEISRFPVSRWLDKGEDDGRISLELEPNKKPASKATAGESSSFSVAVCETAFLPSRTRQTCSGPEQE